MLGTRRRLPATETPPAAGVGRQSPPGRQLPRRAAFILGGGLLAAVSVLAALKVAYLTFGAHELDTADGVLKLALLAAAYAGGLLAVTYGWTLDIKKAIRWTGIALLVTAAVLLVVFAAGGFSWSSDDKDSDSKGGSFGSGSDSGWSFFGGHGDAGSKASRPARTTSGGPYGSPALCPGCGRLSGSGPGGLCAACTKGHLW